MGDPTGPGVVQVWPVVCATGHRPHSQRDPAPLPARSHRWVQLELERVAAHLTRRYATATAGSGMALGPDQWWALAARRVGMALRAHVPYPQQPDLWPVEDRQRWETLLAAARGEAGVRVYGASYDVRLLHARNVGMVEEAAAVVAVWNPAVRAGGTWETLRYAARRRLPIVHLDPAAQTTALLPTALRRQLLR